LDEDITDGFFKDGVLNPATLFAVPN